MTILVLSKLFIFKVQNQEYKKEDFCLTVIGNQLLEALCAICSTKDFLNFIFWLFLELFDLSLGKHKCQTGVEVLS